MTVMFCYKVQMLSVPSSDANLHNVNKRSVLEKNKDCSVWIMFIGKIKVGRKNCQNHELIRTGIYVDNVGLYLVLLFYNDI